MHTDHSSSKRDSSDLDAIVDAARMLQFDEYDRFDEKVGNIVADDNPIVSGDHGVLLRNRESGFAELVWSAFS